MAYVILHRVVGARGDEGKWEALPRLADDEHAAIALQTNVEKANPNTRTQRKWIEL